MTSVLLYDYAAPGKATPREYDLTTSRIAVFGDPACGKSSLIVRWIHNVYQSNEEFHLEDIYHKRMNYDLLVRSQNHDEYYQLITKQAHTYNHQSHTEHCENDQCVCVDDQDLHLVKKNPVLDVQVLDVTDIDVTDYSEMRNIQTQQADGFILCYDSTNEESLDNLRMYQRRIWMLRGEGVPLLLCGNKCDMGTERKVDVGMVRELCDEFQVDFKTCHFETSAKDNFGVNELFFSCLLNIEKMKESMRVERRSTSPPPILGRDSCGSDEYSRGGDSNENGAPQPLVEDSDVCEKQIPIEPVDSTPRTVHDERIIYTPKSDGEVISVPPTNLKRKVNREVTPRTKSVSKPKKNSCCIIC